MSALQLGLLVIGAVVILAVVAYNQWVARRHLPKRSRLAPESAVTEPAAEPLLTEPGLTERLEPTLGEDPVTATAQDGGDAPAPPVVSRTACLTPTLDALVPLVLEQVVSGDAVLMALPGTRRVGSKPFFVEGQNATTGEWETPRSGQRYTALQAGVQLANRMGPLNEIEFSEFVVKVQAFADAMAATADFPDMMQEVARARELDQFAGVHDAQLAFTLRARRAAWSPGYLAQHAAAVGFVAGALPGRMVLPGALPGGAPVLVLQYETQAALAEDPEQTILRDCLLMLDVPHVARQERPFVRLREAATALAGRMEGVVTDASGQLLGTDQMDRIGADLEQLYDALEARELPAGSALTRRLFS